MKVLSFALAPFFIDSRKQSLKDTTNEENKNCKLEGIYPPILYMHLVKS